MIKNLFQKLRSGLSQDEKISYEKARNVLENQEEKNKQSLAQNKGTEPEILYYLAEDKSSEIRQQVAHNPNTPYQANQILVSDENNEVRQELARKITRILPDLPEDQKNQVREKTLEILEVLAEDQLPEVRRILSEELKTSNKIPHKIAKKLASDKELMVCGPMLEYSPLLSDDDLKEIIAVTTVEGALSTIAARDNLSEEISHSIATSLEIPAVSTLLANKNAQIREETLDLIIQEAHTVEEWHEPLATRPNLSIRAVKRIAGFVASSLVNKMIESHKLEQSLADDLLSRVRERINESSVGADDEQTLAAHARDLFEKGVVDDDFIQNAIKNKQRELVIQCLILLSNMPSESVRKILTSKKGKRIVALAWRAELSMRSALEIQKNIAFIGPDQFVNAKNGTDFPHSTEEMDYELALYEGG